jgi:hypothetical protein
MRRFPAVLLAAGLLAAGLLVPGFGPAAGAPLPGTGSSCPLFPADNVWHADVSGLPVHPRSADWLYSMGGPDRRLHPDFGPNGNDQPYGIPYAVVAGSTPKVAVTFDYDDESDPGPYPFGPATPVEGGSDAHALMVDKDSCVLYELFASEWNGGRPRAGSGAVWDLRSHALRPSGWTSADAAGLPILPGLLRRDEVAAGEVDHAIRLTASRTDKSFLWPARHHAGAARDPSLPPMGAWFRLKAGFDITRYRPDTQVVLRAMQRHGLILADNGSNWYFTGTSEPGWDSALLAQLKTIPAGAFEAVDTSSLMADPNSGRVASTSSTSPPPPTAPATTATTAHPTTTTTRPKATTTTTRPTATTASTPVTATTTDPATATSASAPPDPAPSTTTTVDDPAGPLASGAPTGETKPSSGSGRPWLATVPATAALAAAIGLRRRRRRSAISGG